MSRFTKKNLQNIQRIFEEKTGTQLQSAMVHLPLRKLVIPAAALICCFVLAAFTYPLFTPLDGDELTLSGTYEGNGIVSIYVENRSDKDLMFQEQTKLMRWATSDEVEPLAGKAKFKNTKFSANSSGIMTIDLSEAYDVQSLENPEHNPEWYYLVLTNNGFLFGHDWMCSIEFTKEAAAEKNSEHLTVEAEALAEIEEELRFYFEDSYQDEIMGQNEQNFVYLQKVYEMIQRFDGSVVAPVSPRIMVSSPSVFLDPQPAIQRELEGMDSEWTTIDGYSRLIGATTSEKALAVWANIPLRQYPDSVSSIPLVYTFIYETEIVAEEKFAFLYGQFYRFAELERYKVFADSHYVIYNVTDLLYTDLDAYIDFICETREDLLIDESGRHRIYNIYDYYMDKENLSQAIYFLTFDEKK